MEADRFPPDHHAPPGELRPVPPGQRRRAAACARRALRARIGSPRSSDGCGPRPTGPATHSERPRSTPAGCWRPRPRWPTSPPSTTGGRSMPPGSGSPTTSTGPVSRRWPPTSSSRWVGPATCRPGPTWPGRPSSTAGSSDLAAALGQQSQLVGESGGAGRPALPASTRHHRAEPVGRSPAPGGRPHHHAHRRAPPSPGTAPWPGLSPGSTRASPAFRREQLVSHDEQLIGQLATMGDLIDDRAGEL